MAIHKRKQRAARGKVRRPRKTSKLVRRARKTSRRVPGLGNGLTIVYSERRVLTPNVPSGVAGRAAVTRSKDLPLPPIGFRASPFKPLPALPPKQSPLAQEAGMMQDMQQQLLHAAEERRRAEERQAEQLALMYGRTAELLARDMPQPETETREELVQRLSAKARKSLQVMLDRPGLKGTYNKWYEGQRDIINNALSKAAGMGVTPSEILGEDGARIFSELNAEERALQQAKDESARLQAAEENRARLQAAAVAAGQEKRHRAFVQKLVENFRRVREQKELAKLAQNPQAVQALAQQEQQLAAQVENQEMLADQAAAEVAALVADRDLEGPTSVPNPEMRRLHERALSALKEMPLRLANKDFLLLARSLTDYESIERMAADAGFSMKDDVLGEDGQLIYDQLNADPVFNGLREYRRLMKEVIVQGNAAENERNQEAVTAARERYVRLVNAAKQGYGFTENAILPNEERPNFAANIVQRGINRVADFVGFAF